jgi:hypothetical protein
MERLALTLSIAILAFVAEELTKGCAAWFYWAAFSHLGCEGAAMGAHVIPLLRARERSTS